MTETPDQQVRRLLDYFEARVDLGHVAKVRDRHRAAMRYEPTIPSPKFILGEIGSF